MIAGVFLFVIIHCLQTKYEAIYRMSLSKGDIYLLRYT